VFNRTRSSTNTNQDPIGLSLSPNKKEYSIFSFLSESIMKILNSKFDIISNFNSMLDVFILIFDFLFIKIKSINEWILNNFLDPIGFLIVHFKTFKPFLLNEHNLSQILKLLMDEGTIATFVSNKILIYQSRLLTYLIMKRILWYNSITLISQWYRTPETFVWITWNYLIKSH